MYSIYRRKKISSDYVFLNAKISGRPQKCCDTCIGGPWLPFDDSFRVVASCPGCLGPSRVKDLIDHNSKTWKRNVITQFSIPIGSNEVPDSMIWHYSNHGHCSVKSAYHLLRKKEPMTSKHNSLPTLENLKHCHRSFTPIALCGEKEETLEHVLFFCPYALQVWTVSSLGFHPRQEGFTYFADWWKDMHPTMSKENLSSSIAIAAQLCHAICRARNNLIFDNLNMELVQVWKLATEVISGTMDHPIIPATQQAIDSSWTRPDRGKVETSDLRLTKHFVSVRLSAEFE